MIKDQKLNRLYFVSAFLQPADGNITVLCCEEELLEDCHDEQSIVPSMAGHPSHRPHMPRGLPNHQQHSTVMNQLLVDVWGLHPTFLDDPEAVDSIMRRVLVFSSISVVSQDAHRFPGQGLTLTYLLSESHAAVHTWPESGFAAFDFLTCGAADLTKLNDHLR